jgi:hypothetical protein
LIRRAAFHALAGQRDSGGAAGGADIDLVTYGMLTDRLGRTFHRLGLKRVPRTVVPTLDEYLQRRSTVEAAE